MNRVLDFDEQTPWGCRWTRMARPVAGASGRRPQEVIWICVRAGNRRYVSDEECETCDDWQPHAAD